LSLGVAVAFTERAAADEVPVSMDICLRTVVTGDDRSDTSGSISSGTPTSDDPIIIPVDSMLLALPWLLLVIGRADVAVVVRGDPGPACIAEGSDRSEVLPALAAPVACIELLGL